MFPTVRTFGNKENKILSYKEFVLVWIEGRHSKFCHFVWNLCSQQTSNTQTISFHTKYDLWSAMGLRSYWLYWSFTYYITKEYVHCCFHMMLNSDQGRNYESNIFQELCALLPIKKTRATVRNPKCNRLIELFNGTAN